MSIESDQPDPAPVGGQRPGQRSGDGIVPTEVDAQGAPVQLGGKVLDHLRHAMHVEVGDRPVALVTDGDTTEIDAPFAMEGGETAEAITDLERTQVGPRWRQRGAGRRHTDHQDLRVGMLLGEPISARGQCGSLIGIGDQRIGAPVAIPKRFQSIGCRRPAHVPRGGRCRSRRRHGAAPPWRDRWSGLVPPGRLPAVPSATT